MPHRRHAACRKTVKLPRTRTLAQSRIASLHVQHKFERISDIAILKRKMRQRIVKQFAEITVIGRDREGIVAAFTGFVFRNGGNIESIRQNVIEGLFGMHLQVSFDAGANIQELDEKIQDLGRQEKMDVSMYTATSKANIAIFVTREPGCLAALLEEREKLTGKIAVVVGTEDTLRSAAEKAGIPFVLISERRQGAAEEELLRTCKEYKIGLIVLARYMRILTPNFVWRYPNRIINIHPSLLPAFPGAYAYSQAFERGTKIIGVTSHYVTESLDQGPIIFQDAFKVDPAYSLEEIKKRGQALEARTILRAVKMHLAGRLEVRWRKVHAKPARKR